jgi:hypothetical protein
VKSQFDSRIVPRRSWPRSRRRDARASHAGCITWSGHLCCQMVAGDNGSETSNGSGQQKMLASFSASLSNTETTSSTSAATLPVASAIKRATVPGASWPSNSLKTRLPQSLTAANTTSTAADAIITFAGGWNTAYHIYVRSIQCGRTDAGSSAIHVTLNDSASTVLVLPNSGGGGMVAVSFESPLQVAADTNLTMTLSTNTTTVYCSAQGFVAN